MKVTVWIGLFAVQLLVQRGQAQQCVDPPACCLNKTSINDSFNAARAKWNLTSTATVQNQGIAEVNLLGQVLDETVRILSSRCKIPLANIIRLLPNLTIKDTAIDSFCPAYLKGTNLTCTSTKYRSFDGTCNNLANPLWGSTFTAQQRLLPAEFADGLSSPRNSSKTPSTLGLPTPRAVSNLVHKDLGAVDQGVTLYVPAWGQVIDHDFIRTPNYVDISNKAPSCCTNTTSVSAVGCMALPISSTDRFYCSFNVSCINFVRSAAAVQKDCRLTPMNPMNVLTTYLDGSFVYGNSKSQADSLRNFTGGLMRTYAPFKSQGLKDLLPLSGSTTCPNCFVAGDTRVNENPMLPVMHTLFMREHNRIATRLATINPSWNDEKLYQEARRIVGAIVQKITYDEFLPVLLGPDYAARNNLTLVSGFFNGYSANTEPSLSAEFSAAAYRFGHSMVPRGVERWSKDHRYTGIDNFRAHFNNPALHNAGYMDQYLVGFANQAAQAMDSSVVKEITNHLYQAPTDFFGRDLASLNIQRGRDNGLPSYLAYRSFCGFSTPSSWNDLSSVFPKEALDGFMQLYKSPNDLDLWPAGITELPLPGGLLGPTFSCIIARAFRNLRTGDRFWFENPGFPSSFTAAQLAEIKKVKLARVICDNGDNIVDIQRDVMKLPDCTTNPRVSCVASALPSINLSLWKE